MHIVRVIPAKSVAYFQAISRLAWIYKWHQKSDLAVLWWFCC
jgi:hypothetical protein